LGTVLCDVGFVSLCSGTCLGVMEKASQASVDALKLLQIHRMPGVDVMIVS
jgi:hypothetical protein